MTAPERHAVTKIDGYRIDATCPGCGADVEFGSNLFVAVCDHCHSPLRLILPEKPPAFLVRPKSSPREQKFAIDRFCKEHRLRLPGMMQSSQLLVPYWRVDGILLKVRNEVERREIVSESDGGQHCEIVETPRRNVTLAPFSSTICATSSLPGVPDTIGLRVQYLSMVPMAEERIPSDAIVQPITGSSEEAIARTVKSAASLSSIAIPGFGTNSNRFFSLSVSLVFYPIAVYESYQEGRASRFIVDMVSDSVTMVDLETDAEIPNSTAPSPLALRENQVSLQFHRCPNCGEDLPTNQSFLYLCANCGEAVTIEGLIPKETEIRWIEAAATPDDCWFPFWVFRPKGRFDETGNNALLIPAFRSGNHEAMFRLIQRASGALKSLTMTTEHAERMMLAPVQLSIAEASAVMIASEARYQAAHDPRPGSVHEPHKWEGGYLLFIPFREEHYFYVDSCLKAITFERSSYRSQRREPAGNSRV